MCRRGGQQTHQLVALLWTGGRCNIYVRWSKDFELVNSIGVNTIFNLVQVEKLYKAILSKLNLVLKETIGFSKENVIFGF